MCSYERRRAGPGAGSVQACTCWSGSWRERRASSSPRVADPYYYAGSGSKNCLASVLELSWAIKRGKVVKSTSTQIVFPEPEPTKKDSEPTKKDSAPERSRITKKQYT